MISASSIGTHSSNVDPMEIKTGMADRGRVLSSLKNVHLIALLIMIGLFGAMSANAQDTFTVSSQSTNGTDTGNANGTIDIDQDGVSDGTWSLRVTGIDPDIEFEQVGGADEFLVEGGEFVSGYWDFLARGNRYDLDAEFTVISSQPGVTFQPSVRGSYTFPAQAGYGFQNNIEQYSIVWSNIGGATGSTPTVLDPRSQLGSTSNITDGITYTQNSFSGSDPLFDRIADFPTAPGATTPNQTCESNGFWRNGCIAWEIGTPAGYQTLSLDGTNAARREALGFGLISQTDMAVTKELTSATPDELSEGQTGSFVIRIENAGDASAGDSAAIGLSWEDALPSGLSLVGANFTIIRNNASFTSLSDAALTSVFEVDLANDTVSFDFGEISNPAFTDRALQLTDVIEVTIEFEVDGTESGAITNTASVIDLVQIDTDDSNDSDTASLTVVEAVPELTIEKSIASVVDTNSNGLIGDAGDTITYDFTVTNTGGTAMAAVTITDTLLSLSNVPITPAVLAPNESGTLTGQTYEITADNVVDGRVENTAETTGVPSVTNLDGTIDASSPLTNPDTGRAYTAGEVTDNSDTGTEPDLDADGNPVDVADPAGTGTGNDPTILNLPTIAPEIQLVKSLSDVTNLVNDSPVNIDGFVGDQLTYEFVVTNTGNVPLANITISDPILGLNDVAVTPDALLPNATGTFTATYIITAADVANGMVENTATAQGQPAATDTSGNILPNVPFIDPTTGAGYGPVEDTSDTGTEARPDPFGNIVTVDDPENTDTNGVAGDDADEPTVVQVPFLAAPPETGLVVTKTVTDGDLSVVLGDIVPYTITAENTTASIAGFVDLLDTLPTGMVFVPDTAEIDGVLAAPQPTIAGTRVTFEDQVLLPGATVTYTFSARVGPNAPLGELTNTVSLRDPATGALLSNIAEATVRREVEAVFDCSDVIGKVFDDRNSDGYQNPPTTSHSHVHPPENSGPRHAHFHNHSSLAPHRHTGATLEDPTYRSETEVEPGLPRVRLVTPTGTIITTDEYGRYSVPCAELPRAMGTNFTLKLDPRSLPTGYRVTTENPRTMRLTAGIMAEMNFGATIGRVIDVDLTATAFSAEGEPVERLIQGIDRLLAQMTDEPALLRLSYFSSGEPAQQVNRKLENLENHIQTRWRNVGEYRLIVERSIKSVQ